MTEVDVVLQGQVEREVQLRLLQRGYEADLRQHPGLPRAALISQLDQHLVHERFTWGLYELVVQRAADLALALMEAKGIPAQGCGVCALKGWRSHGE
jgi:hypothetical protein